MPGGLKCCSMATRSISSRLHDRLLYTRKKNGSGNASASRSRLSLKYKASTRPGRIARIDMHQFYWCAIHFDECNQHTLAWTIRFNDDLAVLDNRFQVVNLKRDMWDSLHKFRIGRTLPVPLPLDAERIVFVVAYGDLKMGQRNFALEGARRGTANTPPCAGASQRKATMDAPVWRARPIQVPASRTGLSGANIELFLMQSAEPHCPMGLAERFASARGRLRHPPQRAAHRRTRRHAQAHRNRRWR